MTFDSPGAFARAVKDRGLNARTSDHVWACGSFEDSMRFLQEGDTSKVEAAQRLMERITYAIPSIGPEWQMAPAGAFPVVPAFLSGRPDCMRRKVHVLRETAPIRVYVNLMSSAMIDPETLEKRGPVFLALVMAMARVRSVELYGVLAGATRGGRHQNVIGGRVTIIRVDPYNVAAVCGLMACPATVRQAGHAWQVEAQGLANSVPSWRDAKGVQERIGVTPDDLYVHRLDTMEEAEFLTSPEKWVAAQVAAHALKMEG